MQLGIRLRNLSCPAVSLHVHKQNSLCHSNPSLFASSKCFRRTIEVEGKEKPGRLDLLSIRYSFTSPSTHAKELNSKWKSKHRSTKSARSVHSRGGFIVALKKSCVYMHTRAEGERCGPRGTSSWTGSRSRSSPASRTGERIQRRRRRQHGPIRSDFDDRFSSNDPA